MAVQPLQNVQQKHGLPASIKQKLEHFMHILGEFLVAYWAHLLTVLLGLLVTAALSVPFLSYFGLDFIAKPLFFSLHYVCAQIPSHSFYIFGHQLGLCARNFSIYTSMFVGSLIFVLSKKQMRGIPWWFWILLMLPMAWDGTTQMFGWRESNWILRVITGSLFGFGNVWFVLPMMQKAMLDTTPVIPANMYMPVQQLPQYQSNALASTIAQQEADNAEIFVLTPDASVAEESHAEALIPSSASVPEDELLPPEIGTGTESQNRL